MTNEIINVFFALTRVESNNLSSISFFLFFFALSSKWNSCLFGFIRACGIWPRRKGRNCSCRENMNNELESSSGSGLKEAPVSRRPDAAMRAVATTAVTTAGLMSSHHHHGHRPLHHHHHHHYNQHQCHCGALKAAFSLKNQLANR